MDDAERAQALSECWLADRLRAAQSADTRRAPSARAGVPVDRPCARCGEPIGLARLAVLPEAPHCLDCQEEIEAMLRRAR